VNILIVRAEPENFLIGYLWFHINIILLFGIFVAGGWASVAITATLLAGSATLFSRLCALAKW
jgi:hypothetical protein